MIALPQYIDAEAWQGFCEMRRVIKKPLTLRAAKMVVYELQRIKDAGHDANAALDQSTNHCWADVYVPKAKEIQAAPGAAVEATQDWIKSHAEPVVIDRAAVSARLAETRQKLRRVA